MTSIHAIGSSPGDAASIEFKGEMDEKSQGTGVGVNIIVPPPPG